MRFWDTSALVPLVVEEEASQLCAAWLQEDPDVLLWGLTRLELVSAIERRAREGRVKRAERTAALHRVERIASEAHEVSDLSAVRARGIALLARHELRAADAAQLGAALLIADDDPASLTVVALDRRLAAAAEREGLRVLTWPTEA